MISAVLFYCLIIDNVGVPIFLRANFSEQLNQNSMLSYLLNVEGRNTDFGTTWYPD